MKKYAAFIAKELSLFAGAVKSSDCSTYISIVGHSKFNLIRVSDHTGHKLSKYALQLRSDVETCRRKNIFNIKDVKQLIALIK